MRRTLALAVAALGLAAYASQPVRADIITFAGIPGGEFGPFVTTVEGSFAYNVIPSTGLLWGERDNGGNPIPHVEGLLGVGGTLQVVRNDVSGGLFTFEGLDVAQFGLGSTTLLVFGLRAGVQQGVDNFVTSATNNVWLTGNSLNLSGVQIDVLRIRLDGTQNGWESADNLRLTPGTTPVPAPPAVVLAGIGLAGIVTRRFVRRGPKPELAI